MSSSRLAARLLTTAALALVTVAAPAAAKKPDAAPAVAPGAVDPKNISKAVRPPLLEAQKQEAAGDAAMALAMKLEVAGSKTDAATKKTEAAGNYTAALSQVRTAEGVGGLNSTDMFFIAQMKLGLATKTKDNALMAEALKSAVNSEFLPATEKPKYIRNLASIALQANDYDTATHYYEQLAELTPNDSEVLTNLAVLYSRQKQNPQAVAALKKAIAAAKANGKLADENLYRTELKIAVDAKMTAEVQTASMDLIVAYPTPVNWRDALLLFRDSQKLDDQANLDVFRLMDTAGALNGERDYAEYVETAIQRGLPGEAKTVLAEGVQKGMVSSSKPYIAEYSKSITARIGADRAGLAAVDKEARGAANGKTALGEGDAYYGYADYAKAAEMYRLALTKGGIDAATANLRLGAALARGGDKAGAATAFAAVSGGPRATLAQYWTLWLAQKG